MFEKEAIRHAFEDTIGVECLIKPVEDFTYEELSDEQQEKAYDFKKGAEFGYNKANEKFKICEQNADTYYDQLQKAKRIIQEFLDLNYSEFTKTNAVFLHADKFLKET